MKNKLILIGVLSLAACTPAGAGAAEHPLVIVDGFVTNGAPAAVKLPLRITMDRQLAVIEAEKNKDVTTDGEWLPENNILARQTNFTFKTGGKVPSFQQACAFYADKPDTILYCELKALERHDDWDVPGFRRDYVRAFAENVLKIRPGFTNVIAVTTSVGLLNTLKALYPKCPIGYISRYRGGAANDYRLAGWANRGFRWLWFDFKDTPVQTVRKAKDLGCKVILASVANEIEYRQAWLMGADAVVTANAGLARFNKTPPKPRTAGIPNGAYLLGFTKCVVDERDIRPEDICCDPTDRTPAKWYSGLWYSREKPPKSCYTNRWGFLEMESDSVIMSTPPEFGAKGLLPVLHGKDGFYIEFTVSLSDFHPSHACSLWLFPTEKLPGGGPVPWFMELDVDEAKFGLGLTGSIHSYGEGNPMHLSNFNNGRLTELDRTKPITFAASYDPKTQQVAWWHSTPESDEFDMAVGSPFVPKIAADQDYFWIITSRGPLGHLKDSQPKYRKFVYNVRVFVPESSPIPAVGEKKVKAKGEGEGRTEAKPQPRYTKKPTWMKGKPNGALAYAYTNVVEEWDGGKVEKWKGGKVEGLKGDKGFYVEATFAPGAKAALKLAPKNPKAWRMEVASVATDFGFEGTVRNRDTVSGLDLVNPNAKRYLNPDPKKPVTLGVSYDPWNDHVVFWYDNRYDFQVETPYVPRGASADEYVVTFEGEPLAVKAYGAGADDPACPACPPAKSAKGVPNGAAAYGFTHAAILEEHIRPEDISMDNTKPDFSKKWFNGLWYTDRGKAPAPSHYTVTNGVLNMHSSSIFQSTPYRFKDRGALPVLSGRDGFYTECTMCYSRNDRKYTGAYWLMPTCKLNGGDHPEWFMELDVDESKFGPGLTGTVHNMGQGKPFWIQNWTNCMPDPIQRDVPHTVGAAFDPKTNTVSWWLNGRFTHRTEAPFVPTVARDLEYFVIVQAQKRWIFPDYDCQIHSVKAYVPEK